MRLYGIRFCLIVVISSFVVPDTFGLIQFNDGLSHDINYAINNEIWIDYESPQVQTTVNFYSGASNSQYLYGYNECIVNLYGGTCAHYAYIYNNTEFNVLGGRVTNFLHAYDNTIVNFTAGSLEGIDLHNNSPLNMSGSASLSRLYVYGNSTAIIDDGRISWYLEVSSTSPVYINGGDIEEIRGNESSNIYIKGYNFAVDGTPVGYTEITSLGFDPDPYRRLTGVLFNGDLMDTQFRLSLTGKIILVEAPERHNLTIQVQPNDEGINTTIPNIGSHFIGGAVLLSAQRYISCPKVYRFQEWIGDVADPTSAETTIFMDSDKTVTAVYIDARQCGDECHNNNVFGDYNHDCIIDMADFAQFALNWLTCTKPECD